MNRKFVGLTLVLAIAATVFSGCSSADSTAQSMTSSEFDELLEEQPLAVVENTLIQNSDGTAEMAPVIQNNSTDEIKNVVLSFVAWDENDLPVLIASIDSDESEYILESDYKGINLVGGGVLNSSSYGVTVAENCNIEFYKAIVVSYETFDGETWENPYYDGFCELYKEQKYSEDLTIEVTVVETEYEKATIVASVSEEDETDGAESDNKDTDTEETEETEEESLADEEDAEDEESEEIETETFIITTGEMDEIISSQPLAVISTDYIIQSDQYKSLYPDMLQAVIQNNTEYDIKDAVVAFVAWDKNNLPKKIIGQYDYSDGEYVKEVNYSDINLVGNDTFGDSNGYAIDESCDDIVLIKAIAVSFETFDGVIWENPYYDAFCTLYSGQKYSEDLSAEVDVVNVSDDEQLTSSDEDAENSTTEETNSITAAELDELLAVQPVTITSTAYAVHSSTYKTLYPDQLTATLVNNTDEDIQSAVVAFVAWDENNLPVKIVGKSDYSGGSYVKKCNYNDINLVAGGTFDKSNGGLSLDSDCDEIVTFKAIVVSYETFDGETWENPYYDDFCELYEGKKLAE